MPGTERSRRCSVLPSPPRRRAPAARRRSPPPATPAAGRRRARSGATASRSPRAPAAADGTTRIARGRRPRRRLAGQPQQLPEHAVRFGHGDLLLQDGGHQRVPRPAGAAQPQPRRRRGAAGAPADGSPGSKSSGRSAAPASAGPGCRPRPPRAPTPRSRTSPARRRPAAGWPGRWASSSSARCRRRRKRNVGSPVPRRSRRKPAATSSGQAGRQTSSEAGVAPGSQGAAQGRLPVDERSVERVRAGRQRGAMRSAPSIRMTSPLR